MVNNAPSVYKDASVYKIAGGAALVGKYYFETSNVNECVILEDNKSIGSLRSYLNGYVPNNITGKDFEINVVTKPTATLDPGSVCAIVGVQASPNYGFYAIHYDRGSKKIWAAAPNAAANGWQSSTWYNLDLTFDEYHTFNLKYVDATKQFVFTVDDVELFNVTLSETPTINQQRFAFGHNYSGSYFLAQTVDLINTYCIVDGSLVWGNKR